MGSSPGAAAKVIQASGSPERAGRGDADQPEYVPPSRYTVSPGCAALAAALTDMGEPALVPSPLPVGEA